MTGYYGHMKVLQVFLERFGGRAVNRPMFIAYESVIFGSDAESGVIGSLKILCIRHVGPPFCRYTFRVSKYRYRYTFRVSIHLQGIDTPLGYRYTFEVSI